MAELIERRTAKPNLRSESEFEPRRLRRNFSKWKNICSTFVSLLLLNGRINLCIVELAVAGSGMFMTEIVKISSFKRSPKWEGPSALTVTEVVQEQ